MEQFFPRRLIISIETGRTDNLFTVLRSHQNLLLMHETSELQQLSSSESSGSIKTLLCCPSTQTGTAILFPFHFSAILNMTSGKMQRRCHQRFKALLKDLLSSDDTTVSNTDYETSSNANTLQGCHCENGFQFQCHFISAFCTRGEQNRG